jgi:cytochrome c oxidase cbb3-type subunit III
MQPRVRIVSFAVALAALPAAQAVIRPSAAIAQTSQPAAQPSPLPKQPGPDVPFVAPTHSLQKGAQEQNSLDQFTAANASVLVRVPVSGLHPGGVSLSPNMPNPVADDPDAANRGMRYFVSFNCVGCHAPNGGGGMGPSLSDRVFIYGSEPAQIFLSILQGRPRGMPSWGGLLPDSVVWDLVAYIEKISQAPSPEWGRTVSMTSPDIEQVPAENQLSADPWAHTEPFGYGQNPEGRKQ